MHNVELPKERQSSPGIVKDLDGPYLQSSLKREMSRTVIDVQEKERKHLSRELHDNVNQILSSCKLFLEVAETETTNKDYFLQLAQKHIKSAIDEIRNISHSLNPPCLDGAGLVNSVIELGEHINRSGKIQVHVDVETFNEDFLYSPIKLAIYRMIQEQINNVLKHAKAKNLYLSFHSTDNSIVVTIEDDGVGFNVNKAKKGLGLQNILYRVDCFKGKYHIDSSPGNGCRMRIEMPFYLPVS